MPPLSLSGPALSLPDQVARLILREILAGRLVDGQRLPPERELAAQMGVSVGTLRKALGTLTEQGLLDRVQGSGNYVRAGAEVAGIYSFFRLELCGGGGVPRADLLAVDCNLPDEFGAFTKPSGAHRIRRLRYLDDTPAALEEIWLHARWPLDMASEALAGSLYLAYRTTLDLWIAAAQDAVSVASAPDWAAAPFLPTPGEACGHVLRRAWDRSGALAEISQTWFDPGRVVYVHRIT